MSIQYRPGRPKPWIARVSKPGGGQVSRGFDRKIDAKRWEEDTRSSMRRGDWVDPHLSSIVWDEYAQKVLDSKSHLAARTVETYRRSNQRVTPWLSGVPLNRITVELLETMKSQRLSEAAPETVKKDIVWVRMVLSEAVRRQRLARSPASELDMPRVPKRQMRILSPPEVESLARGMPERYRTIVVLGAYTGMRFGEMAGLKVSSIDMLRRNLLVAHTLVEAGGGKPYVKSTAKSDQSMRTLELGDNVIDELAAHIARHPPLSDGTVFSTARGGYLRRGSFSRIWRAAVEVSVGQPCKPHDLRHTQAAWMIKMGKHAKEIQMRLGHGSISVTLDRYGHLMPRMDRDTADELNEWAIEARSGQDRGKGSATVVPLQRENPL